MASGRLESNCSPATLLAPAALKREGDWCGICGSDLRSGASIRACQECDTPVAHAEVVVTRHPALVEYLREQGVIGEHAQVIEHATPDDVRWCRVIGVLPLHLAAEAVEVWEVPLNVPAELRGQELTLEQVRTFAGKVRKYRIFNLDPQE